MKKENIKQEKFLRQIDTLEALVLSPEGLKGMAIGVGTGFLVGTAVELMKASVGETADIRNVALPTLSAGGWGYTIGHFKPFRDKFYYNVLDAEVSARMVVADLKNLITKSS